MKRNSLTTAVIAGVAGLAGIASVANAVELNSDGLGQVLIYPYYTVNGGNTTLLSVVNTTGNSKAVKVRFLEGRNSQEVLDFNLFLSPFDVWTGGVFTLSDTGGGNLTTSDESCTNPGIKHNSSLPSTSSGQHYVPFRNNQYLGDGGPTTLDRTREGHIEMIEMATIPVDTDLSDDVTHVDGVPLDCSAVASVTTSSPDLAPPSGGLFGAGTIVQPQIGTMYPYNADAIDGFYTLGGNLFTPTSSVLPSLANALTSPTGATAYNFVTSSSGGTGTLVTSDYATINAIDAVSSIFDDSAIHNEYVVEAASSAESEWVVTFPTKRFYVTGAAAPIQPFPKKFSATGGGTACVVVGISYWDREEQTTVSVDDFSPPNTIAPSSLCYEAQVLTFQNAGDFNGVSKVLSSKLTANVDPRAAGFESGWLRLSLDSNNPASETHDLRTSLDGDVFHGLPVTGFLAVNYINSNNGAPGVLANYSGLYRHRASRSCTNGALACS
jgi:hypothetical protein